WVRIARIPGSRLRSAAASLKYAIASPKTLTSRTAVAARTAVDIEKRPPSRPVPLGHWEHLPCPRCSKWRTTGGLASSGEASVMQLLLAQSSTSSDPSAAALAAMAAMSGVFLLGGLVFTVFMIWIYFLILKKAGINPWLSLLMLVPLAGFIVLLILAFSECRSSAETARCARRLACLQAGR